MTHKVRVINDLSFDLFSRAKKGGFNAETDVNSVPPSLCAEALPEFLTELASLRVENPKLRLLMATTDVNDAYIVSQRENRPKPSPQLLLYGWGPRPHRLQTHVRVDGLARQFRSDGVGGRTRSL